MRIHKYLILVLFVLTNILFINGCKKEENPVTPASEHFEPEGWLIRDATQKPILVVWQGQIQTLWNGNKVSDTLYAPLNALSDHLSIKFLDANKNIINAPTDADHKLGWLITDTSFAGVVQDSPTEWAVHLKGKKSGKTTMEFQVLHLGHVDVKTPKIPLQIVVDSTKYGEPVSIRVRYEESGEVLATANELTSTGGISVKKDSLTDHIVVDFADESGRYFQPETPLHSLLVQVADGTIASVTPEPEEPWVFRVKGLKIGNTSIILKLIVGGNAEFTTSPVQITIQ